MRIDLIVKQIVCIKFAVFDDYEKRIFAKWNRLLGFLLVKIVMR